MVVPSDVSLFQMSGFCLGMLTVIAASIAAFRGGTQSRLWGSNALSIMLFGAALAVLTAKNMSGNPTHVLVDGGLTILFFTLFIFGAVVDKNLRKDRSAE